MIFTNHLGISFSSREIKIVNSKAVQYRCIFTIFFPTFYLVKAKKAKTVFFEVFYCVFGNTQRVQFMLSMREDSEKMMVVRGKNAWI